MRIDWTEIVGFEWDAGNARKSEDKHGVRTDEAESIFSNQPLLVVADPPHSSPREQRWRALGRTHDGRLLQVVFTIRARRLRVISGRPMSRRERRIHENEAEAS